MVLDGPLASASGPVEGDLHRAPTVDRQSHLLGRGCLAAANRFFQPAPHALEVEPGLDEEPARRRSGVAQHPEEHVLGADAAMIEPPDFGFRTFHGRMERRCDSVEVRSARLPEAASESAQARQRPWSPDPTAGSQVEHR
jgi:hypothetical protein